MDPRVKTVMTAMEEQLERHLSIDRLSKSVNMSPTRLRQLFKGEVGRSPGRYLKDLRLCRAERLLRDTSMQTMDKHLASMLNEGWEVMTETSHSGNSRGFRPFAKRDTITISFRKPS